METIRRAIGELLEPIPRQPKIKRSEYQETGRYPIVDQSQEQIAGYTDNESLLYQGELPVVIFGDHTRVLKFVDFPFCVGADGTQLLRPVKGNDIRYFFYALRNVDLTNYGYERHFKYLKEEKIPMPPISVQRRIATSLSAYDELIENNQRRIRILEKMASTLYREWFVHFRFPGHEKVKLVGSSLGPIPQGWEVKKLKNSCRLTMGQSPKSEFYNETGEGQPFHQGVSDFGDRFPTDRLFCTVEGRIAEAGDILFSVRAPVGRMNIANKRIVIGRGLSAIRHKDNHQAFLWEQLRDRFQKEDMIGNGAIFAAVTKEDIQGIELICPPDPIVRDATTHFVPIHAQIATLSIQSINLRLTRDLLLPQLLSGTIGFFNTGTNVAQETI